MLAFGDKLLLSVFLFGILAPGSVIAGDINCIPKVCIAVAKTAVRVACGAAAGGTTAALVGDALEHSFGFPKEKTIACGMLIGGILGGEGQTVAKAASILLGFTKKADFGAVAAVMGLATHNNPKALAATMLLGALVKGDYAAAVKEAVVVADGTTEDMKAVTDLLKGGQQNLMLLAAKTSGLLCKDGEEWDNDGGMSENGNGSMTASEGGACALKPWALKMALGNLRSKMVQESKLKPKVVKTTQASQSGTLFGSDIHECVSQKCLTSQAAKIGCGVAGGSHVAQLALSNAAAKYNKDSPDASATVCGGFVGAVMGPNLQLAVQASSAVLGLAKSVHFDSTLAVLAVLAASAGGNAKAGHVTQLVGAIVYGNFSAAIQFAGLILGHSEGKASFAAKLVAPVAATSKAGGDKLEITAKVIELYCNLASQRQPEPHHVGDAVSAMPEPKSGSTSGPCTSMQVLEADLEKTV